MLDRSVPALLALRDGLAYLPHRAPLRSALRQEGVLDPSGLDRLGQNGFHQSVEIEMTRGGGELDEYGAPSAGADGGRVGHRSACERDRSGRHEFERGEQVRDSRRTRARSSASGAPIASFSQAVARRIGKGARRNTAPVTMPRVPSLPTKHCLMS